jgi:hypothetical protein
MFERMNGQEPQDAAQSAQKARGADRCEKCKYVLWWAIALECCKCILIDSQNSACPLRWGAACVQSVPEKGEYMRISSQKITVDCIHEYEQGDPKQY